MSAVDPRELATATAPSRSDWQEALGLLDAALDLEPAALTAWLSALPRGQARLSPLLERLLRSRAERSTDDFMRVPAIAALAGGPAPLQATAQPMAARQDVVGPYRLLRQIGEGGMASVWLADRVDGLLERQVALKLPHLAWGAASFVDRMARERRILASLTHPSIASLYDAGIAADGRPYLVLEYVDGERIDTYAAAHALDTRARVALVVEVARAVAHAHARLVVHRDLKPTNILVDAEGRAHLLDFGIARLIEPALADGAAADSQTTLASGRALTPHYASPEQIRGDAIGTASDVYSLGVVLFELIAGVRPYQFHKGLDVRALADAIAGVEAPRPSDAAPDRAVARQLRGDLDAILARALAKASGDRYATVDAFADDLERHLRGEPVQARPSSPWYRTERWLRRHKLEASLALAVLVAALGGAYAQALVASALAAGAAVALWQRNRAVDQARRARAALERAEQVKSFIASIFTQAVPAAGKGGQVTAVGLLQAAAVRVRSDLVGQPAVAAELGALIGASMNELGEMQAALEWLPRAVELCTRALGPSHRLTLQTRWRLIEAANSTGDLAISEPLLPALVRDVRAARPAAPETLVAALRSLAFVSTKRGREAEAMAALNEAVEVATLHFGQASEVALSTRASLSNTYKHFGQPAEALRAIEPVVPLARAAFGAQRPHAALVAVERTYADALARNHRPRDAVSMLRQVLTDQRSLDVVETERVRVVLTMLAQALTHCGRFAESASMFAEAEAMHHRLCAGVTDEGIVLAESRALACSLGGDGAQALALITRADGWAIGRSETAARLASRAAVRLLAEVAAGCTAQALAGADSLLGSAMDLPATARVRALRVRASLLRETGEIDAACVTSEQGVLAASDERCTDLDRGLMLAEAASCRRAVGDLDRAEQHVEAAAAAWQAGQVDPPSQASGLVAPR